MVKPVPDGFATISAYLVVPDAAEAMKFYARALGAEPGMRMTGPGGHGTVHAEMKLGDSTFMLSDENPQWGSRSPSTLGGTPASMHVYVDDADALFNRAVEAGCTVQYPMEDTFWGDRYGKLEDPYGHVWGIATRREQLSEEEMQRRGDEWFAKMGG